MSLVGGLSSSTNRREKLEIEPNELSTAEYSMNILDITAQLAHHYAIAGRSGGKRSEALAIYVCEQKFCSRFSAKRNLMGIFTVICYSLPTHFIKIISISI
jgi:hypothetical protein